MAFTSLYSVHHGTQEGTKKHYAAGAVRSLNIPNQGTRLRVQHLLVDNKRKGICQTYEHFIWLSKQMAAASMKLSVQSTLLIFPIHGI
jgi:hypothetical protein